jgi:YebC/PmpR family DNA-binding regulatory protein
MSGHSHARTVKHKKDANAAQRSKVFSKLASELTIAAKEGGDPSANPKLRIVIERARSCNMPSANVERAIKRGTGEEAGVELQEVLFEGYGPGNVAVLVEGITDNKNRTLGEIKQALNKYGGKMVEGGAVRWLFDKRGVIVLELAKQPKTGEDLDLLLIDQGAQDLYRYEDGVIEVYTDPTELEQIRTNLANQNIIIESALLQWVPKERITITEQKQTESLLEALEELDDVQNVYSNLK